MNTLNDAKQQSMKCSLALQAAQEAEKTAKEALAKALQVAQDAGQVTLPNDPEAADAVRMRGLQAEQAVTHARSKIVQAGFLVRRTQIAAQEAKERVDRLAPHADALAKLDAALAKVRAKDSAILAAAVKLQSEMAAEVAALQALIAQASEAYSAFPSDVRALDLNLPHYAAQNFGLVNPRDPSLLARLGAYVAFRADEASTAPATAKSTSRPAA